MDKAPNKLMSVYKTGEVEIVDPPVYSGSRREGVYEKYSNRVCFRSAGGRCLRFYL